MLIKKKLYLAKKDLTFLKEYHLKLPCTETIEPGLGNHSDGALNYLVITLNRLRSS